ncbi:MAG: hypothetical protein ABIK28_15610, partial [Planctomycetota bacterium]
MTSSNKLPSEQANVNVNVHVNEADLNDQPNVLDFHPLDESQIPTLVYCAGKIHHINASCMNLLGSIDLNHVIDKPFLDFVKPEGHEFVREKLELAEGNASQAISFGTSLVRSDQSTCDAWIAALPCRHKGEPAFQVIICEVTRGDRLRVMSAERDALQAQSRVYHERMKEAEQAKETAEDRHVDLQLKIRRLVESREASTEKIHSLQKRLKETEEARSAVESERDASIQQLKSSQTERDVARKECNTLQENLNESESARRAAEKVNLDHMAN